MYSRLTLLHEKCNYNQCCIHTHKIDLFNHAVKCLTIQFWARKLPADIAYDRLLDKSKSPDTAVVEYNQGKESWQVSMAFPAMVSTYIDGIYSKDNYSRHSPYRTCGRCGLTHNSSSHCPTSGTQYGKCSHPNTDSICVIPTPYLDLHQQENR